MQSCSRHFASRTLADFPAATSKTTKVSDALCGIAKTVRANCHEAAKEYGDVTSDVLKTLVKLRTLDFVALDRGFYVELSILLLISGVKSGERLVADVLNCLPTPTKAVKPETSMVNMERLKS